MNSKSTKVFETVNTYDSNYPYINLSALDRYCNNVGKNNSNVLISIWKNYFTFGYYICVIPFKPVYNHEANHLGLKTWKLQQIFCFLVMWGFCCFEVVTDVLDQFISTLQSQKKLTAKSYFIAINNLILIISYILFVINITKYSKQIEEQLNIIKLLSLNVPRSTARWCYFYVMFFVITVSCCSLLPLPFRTLQGDYFDSLQESFEYHVNSIRERLFLSPTVDHFSTENVFLGVFHYILRYCWIIINVMHNITISCLLPVTFWLITKCFKEEVKASICASHNLILLTKQCYLVNITRRYEEIKIANDSTNQVWSTMALIWLVDTAIGSMMLMNQLVASRKITNVLSMGFWALSIVIFLILSGETFRMMDCFEGFLLKMENWDRFYDQDKKLLIRMLNELRGKPIGIGATGLYKIDYGFIAQLLVAILTLFLVSFDDEK